MSQHELADTLFALIETVDTPAGSNLVVTAAQMDVPLEISAAVYYSQLVFLGSVPHTRWKSGFLPAVHMSHLSIALIPQEDIPILSPEDISG